jgi:hypothetical protein
MSIYLPTYNNQTTHTHSHKIIKKSADFLNICNKKKSNLFCLVLFCFSFVLLANYYHLIANNKTAKRIKERK